MLGIGKKKVTPEQEADGLGFTFDKAINFFKAIPQNVSEKVQSGTERISQFFQKGGENMKGHFEGFSEMFKGKDLGMEM